MNNTVKNNLKSIVYANVATSIVAFGFWHFDVSETSAIKAPVVGANVINIYKVFETLLRNQDLNTVLVENLPGLLLNTIHMVALFMLFSSPNDDSHFLIGRIAIGLGLLAELLLTSGEYMDEQERNHPHLN